MTTSARRAGLTRPRRFEDSLKAPFYIRPGSGDEGKNAVIVQKRMWIEILSEFPSLTESDIRAVIAFAAAAVSEDLPAPTPIPPEIKVA